VDEEQDEMPVLELLEDESELELLLLLDEDPELEDESDRLLEGEGERLRCLVDSGYLPLSLSDCFSFCETSIAFICGSNGLVGLGGRPISEKE
jgi:hypothetical protein